MLLVGNNATKYCIPCRDGLIADDTNPFDFRLCDKVSGKKYCRQNRYFCLTQYGLVSLYFDVYKQNDNHYPVIARMTSIVIVESPTKARTIKDFLPKTYEVVASMGHVRDLPQSASEIPEKVKKEPWAQLGVNTRKGFKPLYVIPKDKKSIVKELKKRLKGARELILATDEDREGESISWHLIEVLKPNIPVKRMVFHEITESAIQKALENCREINFSLVKAQETRRVLDRLVGYTLSPLLWKKVAVGLSAGRVQSVSVRLIVQKERERRTFRKGSYWDLEAELCKDRIHFKSRLSTVGGEKVATGDDFDKNTGRIAEGKKVLQLDEKEARVLQNRLFEKKWCVIKVEEKKSVRKPSPPFITSTLQQEASQKLRLSPRQTMRTAQRLYERGFITYMRTDSVQLSEQAVKSARKCVMSLYGKEYLTSKIRTFHSASKTAQESHEAIRPAGDTFVAPQKSGLSKDEHALYELIWKRTVATQMVDARLTYSKALFEVEDAVFQTSGRRIDFPGFFRAYVEGSDDPNAAIEDKEVRLPNMKPGDSVTCLDLVAKGHETQPPARYTEASLVKKLDIEGIGRPSTYATIIDTIVNRGYVTVVNHSLIPSFTAFAIINLLEINFPDLVDLGFTAKMEEVLDEIAGNKMDWLPYMKEFFLGKNGLENRVIKKTEQIEPSKFRSIVFDDVSAKIHIGRYGPYFEAETGEKKITASIPQEITPGEFDQEIVDLLILQQSKSAEELGIHPGTGKPVYLLHGAYGPYIQLGDMTEDKVKPKRVTLPKEIKDSEVDMEVALALLSLPREIGRHPQTGGRIVVGISRYGSYIVHEDPGSGKDYRSIPKDDSILTIDLPRALEIYATKKRTRRKAAEPILEIGHHPDSGESICIFNGPYGPYIKYRKTNAALPKDTKPEDVTLDQALDLIETKMASKKPTRRTKR